MALASQSQTAPGLHRGLLRRSSQNSSSPPVILQVQAVDFCRSEPRLVKLEQQLCSLACGDVSSREVTETCLSLLLDCDKTKEVFNVFCSCSWMDRFQDPILSKLFYELVNIQQDSNADILLLAELEMACEELLKVLTHLGAPNTLQLNVVCLLYSLSRLTSLPPSHLEAVQSYLEEIARALWPYSLPSAPNLWGSEAFSDAQCDLLKACGKFLEEKCPVNTERMFQKINSKLISGDISQYARFRLLEIQELRSSGWKLSGTALNYYKAAYQKFKNQSGKNMSAAIDSTPFTKNGFKRIGSFGENSGQDNIKPVTVLRISENELRKSCNNLQEPFVIRDAVAEEEHFMVDQRSCSSAHRIELPAQPRVSLSSGNKDFGNQCASSKDGNLLITARQLSEKVLASPSTVGVMESNLTSSNDSDVHVVDSKPKVDLEKGNTTCSMSSASQDLTKGSVEHVSSPSSTCGEDSDEVFVSTVGRDKVMLAMHRGDFKKLRRPFKSDSSVASATESSVMRAPLLSDSSVGNYADDSKLVSSHLTELVISDDIKETPYELSSGTNSFERAIGSGDSDSNRKVDEEDCGTKTASKNWRVQKKTCSDEIHDVMSAGGNSAVENWRKRSLGDLTASQSNSSSAPNENWRGRNGNSSPDFWSSGSQNENWRVKKSLSVDETRRNANTACTSSGQTKRYSLGDIQLERQDSNEKGKRSPGGGFGLPKQTSQDLEEATSDEQHEAPKSELLEVQLSEEESQGLRWRKLTEIQDDTGCKLFHDREKCTIVIKGDPLLCKAAKKRVYSVIAALQEEFGALVPLSDEILQHLQTEGCCMLAERLALCSGANVKMINDSQLFISGHRTCVNLAKTQLAKIKVMLKYTDDPDVASLSRQDSSEDVGGEQIQTVERLFAALEGRPRLFSQTDVGSTDLKPQEGSLSRDFLLSCASNPLAHQRPADLSLERTEDWVTAIVLVNARRGDQVLSEQKKGFGSPSMDSTKTRHPLA